jgi:SAM-dependent methyltransferase
MKTSANSSEILKQAIIGWDVRNWSKALPWWEEKLPSSLEGCKALEIGSANNGGLALWLGLKGCDVTCMNLLDKFQAVRPVHKHYKVQDRMQYLVHNVKEDLPFEHYDFVVFKSVMGALIAQSNQCKSEIDAAREICKTIWKTLKPGGKLLFAENLKASRMHQVLRSTCNPWQKGWCYPDLSTLRQGLDIFEKTELKTSGVMAAFGRKEWQRDLLARLDQALLNGISPSSSHYIAFVYAEKGKS